MPPKKQTKKVIPAQALPELPPSDNESEATARGEGRDHSDEEVMGLLEPAVSRVRAPSVTPTPSLSIPVTTTTTAFPSRPKATTRVEGAVGGEGVVGTGGSAGVRDRDMEPTVTLSATLLESLFSRLGDTLAARPPPTAGATTVTPDLAHIALNREAIRDLPQFKEGGDLSVYLRGLEAELTELGIGKERWRAILLTKLPAKVKELVVELIEGRAQYDVLKGTLLKRVGKSIRELGVELFPARRRCQKDRVERVREIVALVKRIGMLCPDLPSVKLFMAQSFFYSELSATECGVISGQNPTSLDKLIDAAGLLKEASVVGSGRVESRERGNREAGEGRGPRCFICRKSGHKAFHCPDRKGTNSDNHKPNTTSSTTSNKPTTKKTNWAGSSGSVEGVTLEGEVNGIPCKVIPDTGATITIVPREYVPTCQLLDEFEYIQGVAGAPVRAQCARVNFKLGEDQFRLRVVVASDKLNTDSVLFAIPLDKESAKKLLLGAASEADTSRAGHSGDTPDAQGGAKTTVDSPSLPECASHALSEEQRCLAITRNQTREIEANRVRDEEQAKREAGLLTGIPTITSEEARLILDSLGRLDNNKPAETSS